MTSFYSFINLQEFQNNESCCRVNNYFLEQYQYTEWYNFNFYAYQIVICEDVQNYHRKLHCAM